MQKSHSAPVEEYAVGEYNCSIGTSRIFETLRDKPHRSIATATELWINVQTMMRNIISSYSLTREITIDDVVNKFESEIEGIAEGAGATMPHVKLVFYTTTPRYLASMVRMAKSKTPSTKRQLANYKLELELYPKLLQQEKFNIVECNDRFGSPGTSILMITHHPIDLLARTGFASIHLIDSYTGNVLNRTQWTGKVLPTGRKALAAGIPFNKFTLSVLGDGNKQLNSIERRLTTMFYDAAIQYNWKYDTSIDKQIHDINRDKDPLTQAFWKQYR